MKKFVFATNNAHKLQEVEAIVGEKIEISRSHRRRED